MSENGTQLFYNKQLRPNTVRNGQVDKLLKGDNYKKQNTPKPGDIVVYRDAKGNVVHSAKVSSVDPNTGAVKVTGKGGTEQAVHTNDVTPGPTGAWQDPKATFTYYTKGP